MAIDLTLTIAGVDQTSRVKMGSLRKTDHLNDRVDTLEFEITQPITDSYAPVVSQEVILTDGVDTIFGGSISMLEVVSETPSIITYAVTCTDYSFELDRKLVLERYESLTAGEIASRVVQKYATDFTTTNIVSTVPITSVTFNKITVSAALDKLAKMTNYSWYVDYYKDVHFFEKNSEPAPYTVSLGDGRLIDGTLEFEEDATQIKNRVTVRGGEAEGNVRTVTLLGADGKLLDTGSKLYDLIYKFSERPDVTVGGVAKTVGIDNLDNEADFDCFWSYTEKYVRFKSTTIPGDAVEVDITGMPLYDINVRLSDSASISTYGVYEYEIFEPSIKSRDEAEQFAQAQLDAYKDPTITGSFQTYTSGFRSGQVVTVTSTELGIDDDYLITDVTFKMVSKDLGLWDIKFSTLKTQSIISFFQMLIAERDIGEIEQGLLQVFTSFADTMSISDSISAPTTSTGPYYIQPNVGSGTSPAARINYATLVA